MALAALALIGATGLSLWDMRRQTIETAQADMSNLSRSLADQAHDVFQTLDTILVGLQERAEADGLGTVEIERLRRLLVLRKGALGLVHSLEVIDASGRVLVSSADKPVARARMVGVTLMRHHRDTTSRDAFIGWPIQDGRDGTWVLTVSRRLNNPDGSFAGIVLASIPTSFFRDTYRRFDTGPSGAVLLARGDGLLMARWPMRPEDEGKDLRRGELFTRVIRPYDQARTMHRSILDGTVRYGSYHWVKDAPVLVLAARGKADVLSTWRRSALLHLLGLAGVLAALGLLSRQLSARIGEGEAIRRQLTRSNARLVASEAQMAQVRGWLEMGEQIAQIGNWHLDVAGGNRLTWSDELYRLYGQKRGSFMPSLDKVWALYHPEDRRPVIEASQHGMETGMPWEFVARVLRPDGSMRQMLIRGVPRMDAAGVTVAVFGVAMDITRQKRGEQALLQAHADAEAANQALEAANRTLEAMAMQDALTGLANRRHFDRALDLEFRRAVRSSNSLALIMIDVDQFKSFNDLYGHQAGDACLRTIAGLIQPLLNRPGDVAARYGGEEIAILLPGNTMAGAFSIASRIADAVREKAIAHDGGLNAVVTISAGVEAFVPVHERDLATQLVGNADRALYAAKRGGRDRVVCSPSPHGAAVDERIAVQ